METKKKIQFIRVILLSNGVVDLFAAIALCFPVFKIALPGYASYTNQFAFIAGGWGIAAFTFGIGRIWASHKFEFYWFMVILGLLEGVILSLYSLINVFFLEISLLQAMFPLSVGSVYGVLYLISLLFLLPLEKSN
ncbi:MAG TPA: hypothetical protein ENO17_01615 [Candidatus Atribacteria bacterium]|nr:hypothetical protein [Candidatus Atribacteria bacterium]